MGFEGRWNPGSCPSTTTRVTTVAVFFRVPRRAIASSRVTGAMYPIAPCVSAPQTSSGTVCNAWLASSERKDEADLRPVAVCDDDVPPLIDHRGYVGGRFRHRLPLIGDRLPVCRFDQGVATDGDDCQPPHDSSSRRRAPAPGETTPCASTTLRSSPFRGAATRFRLG